MDTYRGSLDDLYVLLGHSITEVTTRYAHLSPMALSNADASRVLVDLLAQRGQARELENGQSAADGRDRQGR